jgi:hypothetical protein
MAKQKINAIISIWYILCLLLRVFCGNIYRSYLMLHRGIFNNKKRAQLDPREVVKNKKQAIWLFDTLCLKS